MKQLFSRVLLLGLSMMPGQIALAQEADTPDADAAKKIYKQQQPDGSVIYTDKPGPGAEEIRVQQAPTYTPPKTPAFTPYKPPQQPVQTGYSSFSITSPANDEAIRENTGNINVTVSLSPGLDSGHQIEYLLDGQLVKSTSQTAILLENVDRGTHSVTAQVVDAQGKVLTESSVTFHLQRTSALQPGRTPAFPAPKPKP